MAEKIFKEVCKFATCANQIETVVAGTLADEKAENVVPRFLQKNIGKIKGHVVCVHCGGEADIGLDL